MKITRFFLIFSFMVTLMLTIGPALAANEKPNIVVIWGDDIGQSNLSTFTDGCWVTRRPTSTASPMKA